MIAMNNIFLQLIKTKIEQFEKDYMASIAARRKYEQEKNEEEEEE